MASRGKEWVTSSEPSAGYLLASSRAQEAGRFLRHQCFQETKSAGKGIADIARLEKPGEKTRARAGEKKIGTSGRRREASS